MIIEYIENENDVINRIGNESGYRFAAKGDITEQKVRDWATVVSERLRIENVIESISDIKSIIVIQNSKRVAKDSRPKADMKIISLFDYYEEINTTIIYLIIYSDKIVDRFSMENVIPLVLDCETIGSLFDKNKNYIGSKRNIEDYVNVWGQE